mmetsp:Transcript_1787/g.2715  ORF Transcript_1787/g.2715 Transcript_1787/m.2715 type:complete len:281 (-) Transcript_1787:416-1258(-)
MGKYLQNQVRDWIDDWSSSALFLLNGSNVPSSYQLDKPSAETGEPNRIEIAFPFPLTMCPFTKYCSPSPPPAADAASLRGLFSYSGLIRSVAYVFSPKPSMQEIIRVLLSDIAHTLNTRITILAEQNAPEAASSVAFATGFPDCIFLDKSGGVGDMEWELPRRVLFRSADIGGILLSDHIGTDETPAVAVDNANELLSEMSIEKESVAFVEDRPRKRVQSSVQVKQGMISSSGQPSAGDETLAQTTSSNVQKKAKGSLWTYLLGLVIALIALGLGLAFRS